MPRYHFDVYDDLIATDEEGADFPNLEAARGYAIQSARCLVCEQIMQGRLSPDHRIEINDEAGRPLSVVTFRESFTIAGTGQEMFK